MGTWTLTIERWHPATVNELLRSVRTRIRRKKLDREVIMAYTWQQKIPKAQGKRRLSLHIVMGKGQRGADPDAYFKSLNDACVCSGLLVDDSRRYVELTPVTFSRDWQHWGTVLTVEDRHGEYP